MKTASAVRLMSLDTSEAERDARANFDHTETFDRDYFALWQGARRLAMWDIG
jgi:hypothetical protein